MSILENLLAALEKNAAALEANTKALTAAGGTAAAATSTGKAADTKKTSTTKADKPAAPKYTAEEVKAAAVKVKDAFGQPAAKELIKEAGKADELKSIKPENYDAFVEACEEKLAAGNQPAATDDDL
jgi:hypothetical protein